jgi:hypothetical protein
MLKILPTLLHQPTTYSTFKMDSSDYKIAASVARYLASKDKGVSPSAVYVPPQLVQKVIDNAKKHNLSFEEIQKHLPLVPHITEFATKNLKEFEFSAVPKHIKQQYDAGVVPSYRSGGGCRHILDETTGEVQVVMPDDCPPDEKGRFLHNKNQLEKMQKMKNRLRAKLEAKKQQTK